MDWKQRLHLRGPRRIVTLASKNLLIGARITTSLVLAAGLRSLDLVPRASPVNNERPVGDRMPRMEGHQTGVPQVTCVTCGHGVPDLLMVLTRGFGGGRP